MIDFDKLIPTSTPGEGSAFKDAFSTRTPLSSSTSIPTDNATNTPSRTAGGTTPNVNPVSSSSFESDPTLGSVFGSFNLHYDPLETGVERIRESDGTVILDLTPETRVFIFGAEVTKDVISVEVSNSVENGGSCTIQLANPRGKYRVAQQDLMKKWREDKDILQIYDYEWLKGGRQASSSFVEKVTQLLGGAEIANQLREIMTTVNNWSRSATIGTTRMIYEIKFNSSIPKKVGELIFDFRDPVYVFYKGRFSHYWYFAFSGVIDSYTDSDPYGSGQTISLKCVDVLGLLKRKKFTTQGTLFRAGNKETSLQQYDESRVYNLFSDLTGKLDRIIKILFFLQRDVDNIRNNHFYYTPACTFSNQGGDGATLPPYNTSSENTGSENESLYLANWRENHAFDEGSGFLDKQYRVFPLIKPTGPMEYAGDAEKKINNFEFDHRDSQLFPGIRHIDENNQKVLEDTIAFIRSHPEITDWDVEGYVTWFYWETDFQQRLSDMRAMEVAKHLQYYFPSHRFTPIGKGKGSFSAPAGGSDPDPSKYTGRTVTLNVYHYDESGKKHIQPFTIKNYQPKLYIPGKGGLSKNATVTNKVGGWLWGSHDQDAKQEAHETYVTIGNQKIKNYVLQAREATGLKKIQRGYSIEDAENRIVWLKGKRENKQAKQSTAADFNLWFRLTKPFLADPNQFKFSPQLDYYFQYNEIAIDDYKEKNLKIFYDTSVRYWTKNFYIDESKRDNTDYTGWGALTGFGVCGLYPAMSYDFVSNFDIISDVYSAMIAGQHLLDNIVLSPAEKIREMIFGVPTEIMTPDIPKGTGTHFNLFRPRIIFLYPMIFRNKENALPWTVTRLQTHLESATTTFDALQRITTDEELKVYATPVGDIIIEPTMYDFHPTKFFGKIEPRDIIQDRTLTSEGGEDIYFRVSIQTPDGMEFVGYRKDKAYLFNTRADHPFFITLKDQIRITETLKSELLKTSVIVRGTVGQDAGLEQKLLGQLMETLLPYALADNQDAYSNEGLNIMQGLYIADGLPNKLRGGNISTQRSRLTSQKERLIGRYNYQVVTQFIRDCANSTISKVIKDSGSAASRLADQNITRLQDTQINEVVCNIFRSDYQNNPQYQSPDYVINPNYSEFDTKSWITLKLVAPTLWGILRDFYEYETQSSNPSNEAFRLRTSLEGITQAAETLLNAHTFQQFLQAVCYKIVENIAEGRPLNYEEYLTMQQNLRSDATSPIKLTLLHELCKLYEITILSGSTESSDELLDLNGEILQIQRTLETDTFKISTRGDLKALEHAQLYNPREDYIARVGYNPGPIIQNMFIRNGGQAQSFAKSVFNRFLARAYSYSIDMIGRPEICLNRPYYVESRQAIGLLTSYTTTYRADASPFTTTCEVSYIRRNAITYGYTLDELDEVACVRPTNSQESRSNRWFYDRAKEFYKGVYDQQKELSRVTAAREVVRNNALRGGWVGVGAGIAAELGLEMAEAVISSRYPKGGVYVAHDFIGHVDYNLRSETADTIVPTKLISDYNLDPRLSGRLGDDVLTNSEIVALTEALENLHTSFIELQNREQELYQISKRQNMIINQIMELERLENDLRQSTTAEGIARYHDVLNQLVDKKAIRDSNQMMIATKKQNHTIFASRIYGYGDITFDAASMSDSSPPYQGRQVPSRTPLYNESSSTTCLLQAVIKALPSRIRNKWTVIDDRQLATQSTQTISFTDVNSAPNYLKPA